MGTRQSRFAGIAYSAFAAATSLVAAVITHCFVDIVANFVLPHDAYDDGAHASRAFIICVAAMLFICSLVARLSISIGTERSPGKPATRVFQDDANAIRRIAWFVLIIINTIVLLGAMGWSDAVIDGTKIDNFGDLFGGSVTLGIGSSTFIGILVATTFLAFARWLTARQDAIVASLVAFVLRDHSVSARVHLYTERERGHRFTHFKGSTLANRGGKRGPPAFLPAYL